jgi:hypothetical protein
LFKKGELKMKFKPAEGVCYRPDLYLDGLCKKCEYKNYAKCRHNGYTKFATVSKDKNNNSTSKPKKKRGRKRKK